MSELGDGVDDTTIRQYAVHEDRLIITSDDDFVQLPVDSHSGVFYVPDQSLPPHELYHILNAPFIETGVLDQFTAGFESRAFIMKA